MVADGERAAEGRASLAIGHKRIGKKQAMFGRKTIGHGARFAHETTLKDDVLANVTIVSDVAVDQFSCAIDASVMANVHALRIVAIRLAADGAQPLRELGIGRITNLQSGELRTELREQHHVAVARLVQNGDDEVGVIGQRTRHKRRIFDKAIVADGDVPQRGVTHAAGLGKTLDHLDFALVATHTHRAVEIDTTYAARIKRVGHFNA